jgi:ribosomal 50S subunit-recycling heat shock protein
MNTKSILAGVLIATASAATALAQQSGTAATTTVTSEPGKASMVGTMQASAKVVGIDKQTRTVTLGTPQGDRVDVVASDAVKNFDQIKVGDIVTVRYTRALALKLKNTKEAAGAPKVSEGSTTAPPGAQPAFTSGRRVTTVAEVTAVDPKASTITLKGADGKVVTLDVRNPDQFKVIKQGDQVEVTYTEAVAVAVAPGSSPMPQKNK